MSNLEVTTHQHFRTLNLRSVMMPGDPLDSPCLPVPPLLLVEKPLDLAAIQKSFWASLFQNSDLRLDQPLVPQTLVLVHNELHDRNELLLLCARTKPLSRLRHLRSAEFQHRSLVWSRLIHYIFLLLGLLLLSLKPKNLKQATIVRSNVPSRKLFLGINRNNAEFLNNYLFYSMCCRIQHILI